MRCKNCHTVMMETDTHCPSCRSPVARATAAAPGAIAEEPNGLLKMLPMFGGALGGLAYAALTVGQESVAVTSTAPASTGGGTSANPMRKIFGFVLLIVGGLVLMLAAV